MKKYFVLIFLLITATVYFVFYHQDKALKFVPEHTDILILVDTKKCTRQYISGILEHPSFITKKGKTAGASVSLKDTGLKIPDFLQLFHLQGSPLSHWYTVFEINDGQKLLNYVKSQKFISIGNKTFKKDFIFLKVSDGKCLIGTSNSAFNSISGSISSGKNDYRADAFIDDGTGSLSFISGLRTRNFSIHLNDHDIEIKNTFSEYPIDSVLNNLENKTDFLDAGLDAENSKRITTFFGMDFIEAAGIEALQASANLKAVNDTIITYGYDDHFNEIEKKTIQKIVQPDYAVALHSANTERVIRYFKEKKWMNDRNQFTAIPFQPNTVIKDKNSVQIISTRNPVKLLPKGRTNYVFVKNNPLLFSGWKTAPPTGKKMIFQLEYLFYVNRTHAYYVKLQFKKEKLPLILRL